MKETILEEERVLPVLAVRGLVVFPGMIVQFDIGRKKSVLAAKAALDTDSRELFIVTQTDLSESEPMAEDLYKIGVIARIKQVVHIADNGIKLHVEGIERAEIMAQEGFEGYIRWCRRVPPGILLGVMQQKDCGDLADFIAANISLDFEQKQCILDELHPEKRIAKLNDILSDEIKVLSLEREI